MPRKSRFILPRRRASTGNYYRTHRGKILKKRLITPERFTEGILVLMDYYGKTTKRFTTVFYLITAKRFTQTVASGESRTYVGVFDVNNVPASLLRYLIALTKSKKLEEFLFSRSAFSYYNFEETPRGIYTSLKPIMNKAYRTLMFDRKNIRKTYIIDYDFGKIKGPFTPKFILPYFNEERIEIDKLAIDFDLDIKSLYTSFAQGILRPLTPTIWASMENTTSWDINIKEEEVYDLAKARNKRIETTTRIIQGMKSNQTFYAPIIFYHMGKYYCVAGNTRLMAAMLLRITPTVYVFTYKQQ